MSLRAGIYGDSTAIAHSKGGGDAACRVSAWEIPSARWIPVTKGFFDSPSRCSGSLRMTDPARFDSCNSCAGEDARAPTKNLEQVLHIHVLLFLRFGDSGVGDVSFKSVYAFHQAGIGLQGFLRTEIC